MMINFNRLQTLFCLVFLQYGCITLLPAQTQKVIDTDFSKGQLLNIQKIKYSDLVKFHGHSCDGLLEGMQALQVGLNVLYPNGIVDRTNTRVVSKSSPCLTDAANYLTGGRYQYNTFYVDNHISGMYIIQRIDNHKTVIVNRKENVKPKIIDMMGNQAIAKALSYTQLRKLKQLEDDYLKKLKRSNPQSNFTVEELVDYKWESQLKSSFVKTDIINKDVK
ncbi:MAG: formylmethanofuran dehydrogenase subunit E family protein [Bacteroidaceae bacterium]|jgi:acetolactate decarboxylase|nr:formylmethanofuran dehydrogenase subunit E family protein [Bacteroidaceae bacterium]